MTPLQVKYYESLPADDQFVLNIAALIADNITPSEITSSARPGKKLDIKKVAICLEKAAENGLLTNYSYSHTKSLVYTAATPFMIYVYPQLKTFSEQWERLEKYQYYSSNYYYKLRDYFVCFSYLKNLKKQKKNCLTEANKRHLILCRKYSNINLIGRSYL
jgi:hypothetical protein